MGDMRKPDYGSHASDPIYHPMKIAIVSVTKVFYILWATRFA